MDSLTYEQKLERTKQLVFEWYHQFKGQVYVAFSGGKDSTVLLHIVRSMFPEVPAVFNDTGLEYPAIREFVKTFDNVVFLKPKLTFKEVLENYGYPVVSKEQSQYIDQYRNNKSEKTKHTRWFGNKWGQGKISEKWKFLVKAPFKISDRCCSIMKKYPSAKYEKETGRKPMLGVMAEESSLRRTYFNKGQCNMFSSKRPVSKPIFFWTEEDIWRYIEENQVAYCSLYDKGFKRTGCMFCMYGAHRKDDNRFELMKKEYPQLHTYCMEKLRLAEVLRYVKGEVNG